MGKKKVKRIIKRPIKNKAKKKKIKLHYGRLFLALLILTLIIYLITTYLKFPIRNIYIYNNKLYSDQQIIDMAGLSNYPSIITTSNLSIASRLEKDTFIKKVKVTKRKLKEVHIEIEENYPLFYNSTSKKTILKDKSQVKTDMASPILVNYVPDTIYKDFVDKMIEIDRKVIDRISEIKYDPNSVDEERFFITMNDGNYVYLTLLHFEKINNYIDILKNFENKKGILYLDSGEYFKVYE